MPQDHRYFHRFLSSNAICYDEIDFFLLDLFLFRFFSFFSQTSRNLLTLISPENWLVRNITMMYHLISRKPLIVPLTWRDN